MNLSYSVPRGRNKGVPLDCNVQIKSRRMFIKLANQRSNLRRAEILTMLKDQTNPLSRYRFLAFKMSVDAFSKFLKKVGPDHLFRHFEMRGKTKQLNGAPRATHRITSLKDIELSVVCYTPLYSQEMELHRIPHSDKVIQTMIGTIAFSLTVAKTNRLFAVWIRANHFPSRWHLGNPCPYGPETDRKDLRHFFRSVAASVSTLNMSRWGFASAIPLADCKPATVVAIGKFGCQM